MTPTPEAWLTLPQPGEPDAVAPLRSRYLRRTLRLLLDLPAPSPMLPSLLRARTRIGALVASPQAGAVYAALMLPQVGGPLHAAAVTGDPAGALREAVPVLLAELGRRRVLGREGLFWDVPVQRLLVPGAGLVLESGEGGVWFRDGEVDLGAGGVVPLQAGEAPRFLPLRHGGWLALADNNPLSMDEAHPDKSGNALTLGGRSAAAWCDALDAARALIGLALPTLAAEHAGLLATVGPVGFHPEQSLSASFREVIGLVYLSLHPDPLTMAEALIHETQHNKLNLLALLDPVLESGGDTRYVSPVRPDPRPLWGVVLAVHAFLPVAEMYQSLLTQGHPLLDSAVAQARVQAVLQLNHDGMETIRGALRSGQAQASEVGRRLLVGMDRLEAAQAIRLTSLTGRDPAG